MHLVLNELLYMIQIYILQSKGKINQIYDCPSNIYGGSCFVHFLCCSIFFYVRGLSEGAYIYEDERVCCPPRRRERNLKRELDQLIFNENGGV